MKSNRINLAQSLVGLFLLSLLVRGTTASLQAHPLNMDEAYHTVNAITLAQGNGLTERFIWNYLNPPENVIHPGNLYWSPLSSFIALPGMWLAGTSYSAGQIGFVLLSALLPPLTFLMGWQITGHKRQSWLAALLILFSGFYFSVWTAVDTYAPFALFGTLSLYATWRAIESGQYRWAVGTGLCAGLAHLTRADGLLLLAVSLLFVGVSGFRFQISGFRFGKRIALLGIIISTYLVIMAPWFGRNLAVAGAIIPPGGTQTIWLSAYNDLFSYGKDLNLQNYLAWGWKNILQSKGQAAWLNFQTLFAVLGLIVAFPLTIIGWWTKRKHLLFQINFVYLALLWLFMTLVFTFPGPRGALFHSGGAVLPVFFIAAIIGLDASIDFIAQRRQSWNARSAKGVFGAGLVGFAMLISFFTLIQKQKQAKTDLFAVYPQIVSQLANEQATVITNNPPAYVYYGGYQAIAMPNESLETTLRIAQHYGATHLIVDPNHAPAFEPLMTPEVAPAHFKLVGSFAGPVYLYEITGD